MSIQSLSTKELREQLPRVRAGLARGDQYLLIYRSKAIGRIEPIKHKTSNNTQVNGGGLRLQANHAQQLTPEYLKKISSGRYQ